MAQSKNPIHPLVPAFAAFGLVTGAVCLARALGFDDGALVGATPASAIALWAALILRGCGALAAGLGFVAAGLIWGLPPLAAITDGTAHGFAALLGAALMRAIARQRSERTKTKDWLGFLAGVGVFSATVATIWFASGAIGVHAPGVHPLEAAAFEPLGLMTFGAVLASLREIKGIWCGPGAAAWTAGLGLFLLGLLWVALQLPFGADRPSGVALVLSVPFCMWIAMQRRSLDGAALSFVAAHVVLAMLLMQTGSILAPEFVRSVIYLTLLVATCQMLHAVNLDRLAALEEVKSQKRELETRVVERTKRLTAATDALQAADVAKLRFVARVSHEVRTPLNGVLGMAAVVLDGPLEPQVRRNVDLIRTSGLHLLDVINRLLDFARLDGPPRMDEVVEFDLAMLIDEVIAEARCLPYAAGLALRGELAPGVATLRTGYRQGLRQILTNLVGNAAKFTDQGSITVRVPALPGDRLRIEVTDTGIGMAASVQERVFLAYEQVDEASLGRYGGTGLGLAICAEIIKRLGGRIGVQSALGAGSTFWIELDMPAVKPLPVERSKRKVRA